MNLAKKQEINFNLNVRAEELEQDTRPGERDDVRI